MINASIDDGVSRGAGRCSVVVRAVDDANPGVEYDTIYVDWSNTSEPVLAELDFIAAGIEQFENDIFILGRLGRVARVSNGIVSLECIKGPDTYGFLTSIKVIENSIFAVGMCRQVYVRNSDFTWERFDVGVIDDGINMDIVTGFRSIDGFSTNDIYAVGLEGEIWNYRANRWKKIVSPTNVTLEQVKIVSSNELYAAGQAGVILHCTDGNWCVLEQTITEDDFWGLEWFNNCLYLTTDKNIYRLNQDNELELVPPTIDGPNNFSRLRASQGALWSFGGDRAFWTINGSSWHEAEIFSSIKK